MIGRAQTFRAFRWGLRRRANEPEQQEPGPERQQLAEDDLATRRAFGVEGSSTTSGSLAAGAAARIEIWKGSHGIAA